MNVPSFSFGTTAVIRELPASKQTLPESVTARELRVLLEERRDENTPCKQ